MQTTQPAHQMVIYQTAAGTVEVRVEQDTLWLSQEQLAEVIPVTSGTRTLKDALNEALRDWVTNVWTIPFMSLVP